MKKILATLMALTLALSLASCGETETAPEASSETPVSSEAPVSSETPVSSEAQVVDKFSAAYATSAPVIDGEIDDIWATTSKIDTLFEKEEDGYVKILWSETNLYFLGIVSDTLIESIADDNPANHIHLWVSETYGNTEEFGTLPGDWNLAVNQGGINFCYNGNGMRDLATYSANIIENESNGKCEYIIEAEIPIRTEGLTHAAGNFFGIAVTVDEDTENNSYCATHDSESHYKFETVTFTKITLLEKT